MKRTIGLVVFVTGALALLPIARAQNQLAVTRYKYVVVRQQIGADGQKEQQTFTQYIYVSHDGRTLQDFVDPNGKVHSETIYDPHAHIVINADLTHRSATRRTVTENDPPIPGSRSQTLGTERIQGQACEGYENDVNGMRVISWTFHDVASGTDLNAKFTLTRPNGDEWSQNLTAIERNFPVAQNFFELPSGITTVDIGTLVSSKPTKVTPQ